MSGWTDERIDELKRLWATGLSASLIAKRMGGITRNAILGKAHRLGLSERATTSRMRSAHRRVSPLNTGRIRRVFGNTAPKVALDPLIERQMELHLVEPMPVADVLETLRVDLLDLKEHMCRFPVTKEGPHLFCGLQKAAHGSYCEHHARIVFQPAGRHG